MDSGESTSLFGENSEDDFIPPTSSSDDSDENFPVFSWKNRKISNESTQPKMKRKLFTTNDNVSTTNELCLLPDEQNDIPPAVSAQEEHHDRIIVEAEETPKKNVRKVMSNPQKWKCNVRKKAHQAGKPYISRRGKSVPEKQIVNFKNCQVNCKYKCQQKITNDERFDVHVSYYSIPSASEKRHFLINTTQRTLTARPKRRMEVVEDLSIDSPEDEMEVNLNQIKSRRKYTFKYFFEIKGEQIQVCKQFYLGTLAISQKPVYTAHLTKNIITNTPSEDLRGKTENSRRKPKGDPKYAREHMNSIPRVEPHYCRATTKRQYLGSHLSLPKMYDIYKQKCSENSIEPVKKSMYWKIFNTEFNLGFHIPKSDRCDVCEKYHVGEKTNTLSADLENDYQLHLTLKTVMREARKEEKGKSTPVLLFDLQNVILTPQANISSFFYLRKLSVYNLTAYYSVTKQTYCAIWPETMAGRAGNDIASAFKKILDVLNSENDITDLVTWSDSCVPQNRNSIISNAVLDFMRDNSNISSIVMKYSLPGHSCVQEIDNIHSQIEKAFRRNDFYSPIGLVRLLKQVNVHNPFRIIQMKPEDFKDYGSAAKLLNYKTVPYASVSTLKFTRSFGTIHFKSSHDPYEPENCGSIKFNETPNRRCKRSKNKITRDECVLMNKPKIISAINPLPEEKKRDIRTAFPYMPLQDREWYRVVLRID